MSARSEYRHFYFWIAATGHSIRIMRDCDQRKTLLERSFVLAIENVRAARAEDFGLV